MWDKIINWIKCKIFGNCGDKIPAWDKCTLASCWNGSNAQQRMMNMLSPHMTEDKFISYMNWMKGRGCNTAHVFTSNEKNGENAGYCIYGKVWDWNTDSAYYNIMLNRIKTLRKNKFAVVLWLFADDSSKFNSTAKKNFPQYIKDLKKLGFLDYASTIVVGLELDEYYSVNDVNKLVQAVRAEYKGKIGTHQTSGRYDYSPLADICFYQVNPGKTPTWIKNETVRVKSAIGGKPLNFHEIERQPNREKCEAALAGGAFGVGNW